MIKKFFISRKLNEVANLIEENAGKMADGEIRLIDSFNKSTEAFGVIAQVISSAYRLLRVILTVITTDSEEGKLFRALLIDLHKAYAKRLRDSAGFVTALTKNKKIVRAIEAFEEDVDELRVAIRRRYIQNKMAEIDDLQRELSSMLKKLRKNATDSESAEEVDAYEKAYMEYVRAAKTRFAELMDSGKDDDGEAFARFWHLKESLDTYPRVPEFRENKKGWEWYWNKDGDRATTVDRKKGDE